MPDRKMSPDQSFEHEWYMSEESDDLFDEIEAEIEEEKKKVKKSFINRIFGGKA